MVNNLAGNTDFAEAKGKMAKRLMDELTRAQDPRVVENPPRFEQPPFTDGGNGGGKKTAKLRQNRILESIHS